MLKRLIILLVLAAPLREASAQDQADRILSPSNLPALKNSTLRQISSHDPTGGNADFIALKEGATATLAAITGPGIITRIWVTIFSPDPYFLRRILLRMSWDGEATPSVEVPIGDYFGTGFGYRHYTTPWLGMSSGGYYSFFPMPFARSARIEIVNETGQEINSFYYQIDYHLLSEPLDTSLAYFHAQWRREIRTDPRHNYTILEARGRGHLVGVSLQMQGYAGNLQYLEGDEMIYVDGEEQPSIAGTGTEDYFTSGWYFNKGEFAAPTHGLILKDDSLARIAAYRFHITDAVPFRRSIRVTIEHGHANEETADYASTAYWYQREPHAPPPALLSPGLRIPLRVAIPVGAIEAEVATADLGHLTSRLEDMSGSGADWSGLRQLKILCGAEGDRFWLFIPAAEDRYTVDLYYTRGPELGTVRVLSAGEEVGSFKGYAPATVPGGRVRLKGVRLRVGREPLEFVVSGKDSASTGYGVGLDAFVLEPERSYIPQWFMIGPFPNPRDSALQRQGLDRAYLPEQEIDLEKSYPGVDGKPVRWTLESTPENGRMDLYQYDPYELVVVYALTYVYSPKEQTLPLLLGTDDGVKVFLNGRELHRVLTVRIATPDRDTVALPLREGWNPLLLKIENNYGGYNFYARIPDPGGTIVLSPRRQR